MKKPIKMLMRCHSEREFFSPLTKLKHSHVCCSVIKNTWGKKINLSQIVMGKNQQGKYFQACKRV